MFHRTDPLIYTFNYQEFAERKKIYETKEKLRILKFQTNLLKKLGRTQRPKRSSKIEGRQDIVDTLGDAVEDTADAAIVVAEGVSDVAMGVVDGTGDLVETGVDAAEDVADEVVDAVGGVIDGWGGAGGNVIDAATDAAGDAGESVGELGQAAGELAQGVIDAVSDSATGLIDIFTDIVQSVGDVMEEVSTIRTDDIMLQQLDVAYHVFQPYPAFYQKMYFLF